MAVSGSTLLMALLAFAAGCATAATVIALWTRRQRRSVASLAGVVEQSPVRGPSGTAGGAASAEHDLTDLHRAHEQLLAHHRDTLLISESVRAVLGRQEGPEAVIRAAQVITSAALVFLFQPDGHGDLVCTASTPATFLGLRIPLTHDGVVARAFNEGRPMWADDIRTDSRHDRGLMRQIEAAIGEPLGSGACQPIMHAGRCLGVLNIGCPDGAAPPSTRSAMLELLATETAMALAHQELVRELERLSMMDPLTGIANRRGFETELARALPRAVRGGSPISVLMIDLDHFKLYNDTHGHAAGDALLRGVSRAWLERLRPGDLLCRWGGEEFAVLLPGCTSDAARAVAEDLRARTPDGITCSVGVAEWDHAETHHTLLARADGYLYAAKAAGRDRVHA